MFINIELRDVLTIVEGEIPAAETLDLSEKMRGSMAGRGSGTPPSMDAWPETVSSPALK